MRDAEITEEIRSEILRLAPWYFDIEVTAGLRTSLYLDAERQEGTAGIVVDIVNPVDGERSQRETFVPEENVSGSLPRLTLWNPRQDFLHSLHAVYPEGLDGRSVLDCGCNSGAYLFLAKEAGAGTCLGLDVRERWIEQARFLAKHRDGPTEEMRFEVQNLYDLPAMELEPFDVVLFNGLFYHLPDPISALRIAAALTKETLILDTAARRGTSEGALVPTEQARNHMSGGLYGLRWLPNGPSVLFRLLAWMGFNEMRCTWWRPRGPMRDRIEVVAGREKGSLESLDASIGEGERRISAIVSTSVPPNTDVLVASGGNDALLAIEGRRGWHFPQLPDGTYMPEIDADADALMTELESLRNAGAGYLVVPLERPTGLELIPDALDRIRKRFNLIRPGPFCRIFELNEPDGHPFRPRELQAAA